MLFEEIIDEEYHKKIIMIQKSLIVSLFLVG